MLTWCLRALGVISNKRLQRLWAVDPDIVAWDVRMGLPFPDESFDVVYHSNLIEHLRVPVAKLLVSECHRVLKRCGVLRVVTPDLAVLARRYLDSLDAADSGQPDALQAHENAVKELIEQCVREEAEGHKRLPSIARFFEKAVRGDASARGERHHWAYDRLSMGSLLGEVGFESVRVVAFDESGIKQWGDFRLDVDAAGEPRRPNCLYVEATKA